MADVERRWQAPVFRLGSQRNAEHLVADARHRSLDERPAAVQHLRAHGRPGLLSKRLLAREQLEEQAAEAVLVAGGAGLALPLLGGGVLGGAHELAGDGELVLGVAEAYRRLAGDESVGPYI